MGVAVKENANNNQSKVEVLSDELIVTVMKDAESRAFVAVADSGILVTLVSTKVSKLSEKKNKTNGAIKWKTKAGEFLTEVKCKRNKFKLPQFITKKSIAFEANLYKKEGETLQYDFEKISCKLLS